MLKHPGKKIVIKRLMIVIGVLLIIGIAVFFYFQTLTYDDTADIKVDYTVQAIPFIKEFEKNNTEANKKYAEKIIAVNGKVTATEPADSAINIKMADTTSGSYLIFAFQEQHLEEARNIQVGDVVTIKGSCSDGVFSEILGSYFISFKRSTLEK